MKTSATNKKIGVLLQALRAEALIPRPEFLRRLVWSNKHKSAFIETVLRGYPFPEIYIAAGEVDPDTGEETEMLVDGQQRITTLYQYHVDSLDLELAPGIPPYSKLSEDQQIAFLEYEVAIRDLGKIRLDEIREILQRVNSTHYSLNALEIHSMRFDGEFKKFGEALAQNPFFETRKIFRANEIRCMADVRFALIFVITIMSTYFNRDRELEDYLWHYNEEFKWKDRLDYEVQKVFQFIDECDFDNESRAWKKADLLTLLVETHRALIKKGQELDPAEIGKRLKKLYERVNGVATGEEKNKDIADYYTATKHGNTDRTSRITRGQILQRVIQEDLEVKID